MISVRGVPMPMASIASIDRKRIWRYKKFRGGRVDGRRRRSRRIKALGMAEVAQCVRVLIHRATIAASSFVEVRIDRLSEDLHWVTSDDDGTGTSGFEVLSEPDVATLAKNSYERCVRSSASYLIL